MDKGLKDTILRTYSEYWKTHDFDKWLNEFYDDVSDYISEDDFYDRFSYDSYITDKLAYAFWKSNIYENINKEKFHEINYKYKYIYYITSKYNFDRIKKYGLIPERKSKYKKYIYLYS